MEGTGFVKRGLGRTRGAGRGQAAWVCVVVRLPTEQGLNTRPKPKHRGPMASTQEIYGSNRKHEPQMMRCGSMRRLGLATMDAFNTMHNCGLAIRIVLRTFDTFGS